MIALELAAENLHLSSSPVLAYPKPMMCTLVVPSLLAILGFRSIMKAS